MKEKRLVNFACDMRFELRLSQYVKDANTPEASIDFSALLSDIESICRVADTVFHDMTSKSTTMSVETADEKEKQTWLVMKKKISREIKPTLTLLGRSNMLVAMGLTEETGKGAWKDVLTAIEKTVDDRMYIAFSEKDGLNDAYGQGLSRPQVTEVRPQELICDVVRFQNNKEKWVAFVGLLNGYPYEIFTGLQDDEEGIVLPKTVTKGKIIKQVNRDGTKRYDFQFENKRGYKTTVEGLSEKFNPEYWNYAKLISGVLRYGMPISHVIKLVSSLQLQSESINTWKNGVERALKKYVNDGSSSEPTDNQ